MPKPSLGRVKNIQFKETNARYVFHKENPYPKYVPSMSNSYDNLNYYSTNLLIPDKDFSQIWHQTVMMRPIAFYHHEKIRDFECHEKMSKKPYFSLNNSH